MKMQLLDYDYDEGKYVITIEATHKELFHLCTSIEFAGHVLIFDYFNYDRNLMKQLHDFMLDVISQNK